MALFSRNLCIAASLAVLSGGQLHGAERIMVLEEKGGQGREASGPAYRARETGRIEGASKLALPALGGHMLALTKEGQVWAWGGNESGQLGTGDTKARAEWVAVEGLEGIAAISAGAQHGVALRGDGTVLVWGSNFSGQLGDGTLLPQYRAVRVAGLDEVVAIGAGTDFTAALKRDGSVWVFGSNWGELVRGEPRKMLTRPVMALGAGTAVELRVSGARVEVRDAEEQWSVLGRLGHRQAEVEAGIAWPGVTGRARTVRAEGLALIVEEASRNSERIELSGAPSELQAGWTMAWIEGDSKASQSEDKQEGGEARTGAAGPRMAAAGMGGVALPMANGSTPATSIAAGQEHVLLRKPDGTVWAWGSNLYGQLGDGTSEFRSLPVQVIGLTDVVAVSARYRHSLALKSDGSVWAWGYGSSGRLGLGSSLSTNQHIPVRVSGLPSIAGISAGDNHSLAVGSDGSVWAWGANSNGEVGDGTQSYRYAPVQVPALTGVVAVSAGAGHSLALKNDGTVWAWGYNYYGQLGDNSTTTRLSPVQVIGLGSVASIAAGSARSFAVRGDGTVWGWGNNNSGYLGDGSLTSWQTPVQLTALSSMSMVRSGSSHTVAVRSDGTVLAWGSNTYGQLGDGTTVGRTVPIQLTLPTPMTAVATGATFSVALAADGSVRFWGRNASGQAGDGTSGFRTKPAPVVGMNGALAVSVGSGHVLVLKSGGTVWAWGGSNSDGRLGDGTYTASMVPVQASGLSGAIGIAAAGSHSVAVKNDGTVWAWGANYSGQLGVGNTPSTSPVPIQVPGLTSMVAVASRGAHTLALRSDGTVWAWGTNYYGQVGDGTTTTRLTPVPITSLTGIVAIAASQDSSLALRNDGTVWAWGYNGNGQLGDGTTTVRLSPIQVSGLSGIQKIAAGDGQCVALKNDGTIWAWGYGQADDPNPVSIDTFLVPTRQEGPAGLSAISAGYSHRLGLKGDGTLWAWGSNGYGQLGDGTTSYRLTPVAVSMPAGVVSMSAGYRMSAAVRGDGTVWVWGDNSTGQLGFGGYQYLLSTQANLGTYAVTPAAITASAGAGGQGVALSTNTPSIVWQAETASDWLTVTPASGSGAANLNVSWTANTTQFARNGSVTIAGRTVTVRQAAGLAASPVQVAAGYDFTVHLRSDGTVWAWGRNMSGQLGNGSLEDQPAPVRVGTLSGITAIAAGYNWAMALRSDGTVWSWGSNGSGQLGDGSWSTRKLPVQVSGLTGVVGIAAGSDHGLAAKSDGTVWSWGQNFQGQLGDGTTSPRNTAAPVAGLWSITSVAAGAIHSLALRSDGAVLAWGYNGSGQLGDGTRTSRPTPVQLGFSSDVVSIAGSSFGTIILRSDGTIWMLGQGFGGTTLLPRQVVGASDFVKLAGGNVSSGSGVFAGLKSDGSVWVWGSNSYKQLASETLSSSYVPTRAPGLSGIASVAVGASSVIAARSDGTVWGWGSNGWGQIGTGVVGNRLYPVQYSGITGAAAVASGYSHVLVRKTNNSLWSWGSDMYGQATYGVPRRNTPVEIVELGAVKAMSAGNSFSLAVKMDGQVWAWGSNWSGQLGDGTTQERYTPVRALDLTGMVAVAAGSEHALALKSDGTVWAWGANYYGQLGDGTTTGRPSPGLVLGLTGVKAIAAGNGFSLALKTDGTVWAWGNNSSGELGDGTTNPRMLAYQVVGMGGTAAIAAGSGRSLAAKTDGSVWEWGSGVYGSLGTISRVGQLSGVTAVTTSYHSLALNANGTVSAWGDNSYGQLGDGTANFAPPNAPTTAVGLTSVVSISANSFDFSTAVKSDGTVWVWGRNDNGLLGLPGGVYSAPVQTVNLGSYTLSPASISAGAAAGSQAVTLTTGNTLQPWAPASSAPWWLSATPPTGTSNATLTVSWTANAGGSIRTGTITVGNQVVTVTQAPGTSEALRFVAVQPCRVVDTRWPAGSFGGPFMGANSTRSFVIPQGSCGIPSTAKAYSLNVTVVPRAGQLQWLTLWPTGLSQPGVSTLNSYGGDVVANAAVVPAGSNGAVSVYVTNDTEVILDVNGYFDASSGSSFYADTPCRVVDTRWPAGPLGGPGLGTAQTRSFTVPSSTCGIAANATAYAMNYTVVPAGYLGYLSTWPAGSPQPVVSTLNSWRGKVVANAAIVPVGSGGAVSVFASDPTQVILDINGHFGAPGGNGALSFYPVTPCRVADTRNAAGTFGGPILAAGSTRSLPVPQGGCGIPATAKAYSVNVTVVPSGPLGYLTAWPSGQAQPYVSTLNSPDGAVVANAAIVPAGTNGAISVFVTDSTHLIVDINGYFQ